MSVYLYYHKTIFIFLIYKSINLRVLLIDQLFGSCFKLDKLFSSCFKFDQVFSSGFKLPLSTNL